MSMARIYMVAGLAALLSFAGQSAERTESETQTVTNERGGSGSLTFGNGDNGVTLTGGTSESQTRTSTTSDGNTSNSDSSGSSSSAGISYSHSEQNGNGKDTSTIGLSGGSSSSSDGGDGSSVTLGGSQTHTETNTRQTADGRGNVTGTTTDSTHVGITTEAGDDGSSTVKVGADRTVGGSENVTYGDQNGTHAGGTVSGEGSAKAGGQVTTGPGGITAEAEVGISAQGTISVEGQYGSDQYNVHGSGEITISAELAAKLKTQLTIDENGMAAVAGGELGAAVSLDGKITGGVTICGVPIDVTLSGGVSAGAKVAAQAGAVFDAKTGTLVITLEASAVLGAGAHGGVQVSVGVDQLKDLLIHGVASGAEKLFTAIIGDESDYIKDILSTSDLGERIKKMLKHELDKNERWRNMGGANLLQNILDMIANGCDFGLAYQLARAAARNDTEEFNRLLELIRAKIAANKKSDDGDPFDNGATDDGSVAGSEASGGQNEIRGVTPIKY